MGRRATGRDVGWAQGKDVNGAMSEVGSVGVCGARRNERGRPGVGGGNGYKDRKWV
jgi:hypothetical protein